MMRGLVSATYDLTTSAKRGEVGTSAPVADFTSTAVTCSSLKDASRLDMTAFGAARLRPSFDDQEPEL
jgi:hypothetical protein